MGLTECTDILVGYYKSITNQTYEADFVNVCSINPFFLELIPSVASWRSMNAAVNWKMPVSPTGDLWFSSLAMKHSPTWVIPSL
jgi:hypothetical protein